MKDERTLYIDYLRVLAMCFIVMAHTICTPFSYKAELYSRGGYMQL